MAQTQAKPYTLQFKRVIKAPRERVYNAFLSPDALCKWLPPGGFVGKVYYLEPKVGGRFRMSFTTLDGSQSHAFGGEYLELRPFDRIRYSDKFETDDPRMLGEMLVTATFVDVPGGTELSIIQEGVPAFIPIEGSTTGWNMSLDNLTRLVEF